ncbi:MAG TPA: extracellular solute-binding protein [Burkholderiales bacterium]|nr:extracellular solute-binding protein [Burkholderiales bacterium]
MIASLKAEGVNRKAAGGLSIRFSTFAFRLAIAAGIAGAAQAVYAQPKPAAPSVAEIALYQGADRAQRLAAGAKKEGAVSVYTSATVEDMAILTAAFEKKHGIKVSVWRASSEGIIQRGVAEMRGGRNEADIFETNGPDMESLHREKVLQEAWSPHFTELVPGAVAPHREWVGARINIYVMTYNTKLVRKEDLPKSFEDLAHPRWKGKLGIEASDPAWFAMVVNDLGEAKGLKIFRDIVAANGISVRKGHTLLTNLVVAGEVPLALTTYHYRVEQTKKAGAPVDWFILPPAVARFQGMGLARRAPHPHAAMLFYDFMLTDAQELLAKREFTVTSRKIDSPAQKLPLKFVDPKWVLDENEKWSKLYTEIVTRQLK